MNPCLLVFSASASQPTLIKAVARFLITGVGGIIASAEGPSLLGGSWRYFPPETFQIWRLRNAIFITPKNRPRISVKMQVFSVLILSTLNICNSSKQYIYKPISLGGFASFCLLFAHTGRGPNNFSAMTMANNCKSLQSKQLRLKKTYASTNLICLAQQVPGGRSCPASPRWLRLCLSHSI